ncbi:saccharopine dehydrogenase-like NADP-dependent oxidoreductase [Actinoplanes octamycinicus]|uniref:Saccharopine dehydrogenase-like NADP-dependent oxidoreductase n=1 Tax=Actinoplanes octamycinicus TaxID=135948 RepID=A0A7W7MA09_9ACTN|nr:NAD(P)H-binding protein [Actinoplanes octamycinicus]MBB4742593.1 saccharopine dehydrogenase-like NADP-dependent oxidoreductase [Actinoplanes octamycinicus]GIE60931.1 saccharopine dehydrogenase [Actinoplanes octamycinicus]
MSATIAVYGATGTTGRHVTTELHRRGHTPLLLGRDHTRLTALGEHPRPAAVDDPAALDRALHGADAVINTAGPFATTAGPLIAAAQRAGIPYIDVAAEIEANLDTFRQHTDSPTLIIPAMAFYGGLADLLATTALDGDTHADEIHIAYGLTSWHPTPGTLAAGAVSAQRRGGRRLRYTDGTLQHHDDTLPTVTWPFPHPLGPQKVLAGFTMADVVTIPTHLQVRDITTYMTTTAATDLANAGTRTQTPETFTVDVQVRTGRTERRITATGQDIYAISAPLAVEATDRILTGRAHRTRGVASAGTAFDAPDFLHALHHHLTIS